MKLIKLSQRGDTLLEVVFALVILSVVLVGALGLARLSRVNSQNSQSRAQAINLIQEQYEALKAFRDSNPYGWAGFGGLAACNAGCSNYTLGVVGAITHALAPPGCVPSAPGPNCVFHMERDGRQPPGSDYGQWIPCPGYWHPPIDEDTGWTPFNATGLYSSTLASKGCMGDDRTDPSGNGQDNIQVGIQLASPASCPQPSYFQFNVVGTWKEGGASATSKSSLSTLLSNLKNGSTAPLC